MMTSMAVHGFMLLLLLLTMHQSSVEANPSSSLYPTPSSSVRAAYWPSGTDFATSSINTNYFSHIYYAFVEPDPADSFKLIVTQSTQTEIHNFINGLRNRSPPVKTLLSIGGGGSNSSAFAAMAGTSQTRSVFINSTIQVARQYGFDGLDLDWEFPDTRQDMSNLALLFQEWYQALVSESRIQRKPRLLLTAAVYYSNTILLIGNEPRSYPAEAIGKYLDWASPMNFDYHGAWSNFTGVNAALFDPKSNISTHYGIGSWIRAGVPRSKLVMGLPLYGRTWKLEDPNVHGIGAQAVGPATDTNGTIRFWNSIRRMGLPLFMIGLVCLITLTPALPGSRMMTSGPLKGKSSSLAQWAYMAISFGPLIRTRIGPSRDKLQIHGVEGTRLLTIICVVQALIHEHNIGIGPTTDFNPNKDSVQVPCCVRNWRMLYILASVIN